ncbi:radical SAM protein [Pseudomonas sp. TMP25]|uniref:GTP 3',8-cyclase MoaA n=1 Tax=Pseudomonas sp. TMP25 TaxID=3136561 RepID=UPI0031014B84
MIVDRHGRRFRKLRLSLTAACNYACTYCVADGRRLVAARDELTAASMLHAVELLRDVAGVEALRITGGEPLLSDRLEPFLRGLGTLAFQDISLTTNGQLLAGKLPILRSAGIQRLNVSLDTLDPSAFRKIAKGGDLQTVLSGIEQARRAGMSIKINMVPMRGSNLDQVMLMLAFCVQQGYELRFIELMRMGHLAQHAEAFRAQFVGQRELLELIGERYEFSQAEAPVDSTALRYDISDGGAFGIIANESVPFCRSCSRLRLSSTGWLYGCLSSNRGHFMGDLLALPSDQAHPQLAGLLSRALGDKQDATFTGSALIMKSLGG